MQLVGMIGSEGESHHRTDIVSDHGGQLGALRIEPTSEASTAPFESPFAPSAVSTFSTNFVLVTVDKCHVRSAYITSK